MECLSDKQHRQQDRRMALSYMQEAQLTAGLLVSHSLNMKQDGEKRHSSPPLNNNTATSAASLFSGMGAAAAAAASLSMLTPQQLLAASHMSHALMAAGLPVSLGASSPSLYRHHQTLFSSWASSAASSPPSPLHRSPGPVSPALSSKSGSGGARKTPNSQQQQQHIANNNNNNNVVSSSSSSAERKKAAAAAKKQQRQPIVKQTTGKEIATLDSVATSPPSSISPEAGKDGRDKVFTCGVCSRSFGYKHVLQNHERTHTGEKPFKCPECHKRFTRDHHLKTHMRLHTGEKPYHCSHCDRQFVQVANLRRHLRVHTGERPYACELCSAKFSDSNQLKAHLLIHKNEKPFKCEHCQMRFRRRHHLVHHKCGALAGTTILPGSLVTTQLGVASPSLASDDLEDDIDVDIDVEMDEDSLLARHKQSSTAVAIRRNLPMRQLPSPSTLLAASSTLPLNLSGIPLDLPEQTEPEDLSMTSRMARERPHSHSSGGAVSPMSHSPSSDDIHDDELDEEEHQLDDSLFTPETHRVR